MKRRILNSFLSIMLFFAVNFANAGAIETLKQFNEELSSLSGNFTQTVQNAKRTQTTSGTFAVLRPGYFKWNYVSPFKQLIIGDGQTIWLYDEDLAQVVKRPQAKSLGASPAAVLSDKKAILDTFVLKEEESKNGVDYVSATPKTENSGYDYIMIGFKGNTLVSMFLKDSYGNQINIQFANLSQKALSAKGFNFSPPDGVDILSN